jgi:hypothetical protein
MRDGLRLLRVTSRWHLAVQSGKRTGAAPCIGCCSGAMGLWYGVPNILERVPKTDQNLTSPDSRSDSADDPIKI